MNGAPLTANYSSSPAALVAAAGKRETATAPGEQHCGTVVMFSAAARRQPGFLG